MPHWRKLHLKVTDSFDVNDMPDDFTRLLWVLMPLALDSAGRGIDDPAWVKAKLMPLRRAVTLRRVTDAMKWYAERGMTEHYEAEGRSYFWVPTFAKYQGNTDREAASVLPEPVKQIRKSKSRPTHELVASRSSSEEKRVEEKRVEGSNGAVAPPPSLPAQIKVYEENGGQYPTGKLIDGTSKKDHAKAYIVEHVADTPGSLALWGKVVFAYQAQWSGKSYTVMVNDYYKRDRIPGQSSAAPENVFKPGTVYT